MAARLPNVVADFAETELDLRVWNDDDYNEVNAKIMQLAQQEWVAGVTAESLKRTTMVPPLTSHRQWPAY